MDELRRGYQGDVVTGATSEAVRELDGGGGVNWGRILERITEDVSGAEAEALRGAMVRYLQEQIFYGQLENLRGSEPVMERLGIKDITLSDEYLGFIKLFTDRVSLPDLVSFVMRITRQVRPGEKPVDERAEAREYLEKRFLPEIVDDRFVQTFLDLDQFLVKLMEHGKVDLSQIPIAKIPRLLSSN